jgi:hypothetical protein
MPSQMEHGVQAKGARRPRYPRPFPFWKSPPAVVVLVSLDE